VFHRLLRQQAGSSPASGTIPLQSFDCKGIFASFSNYCHQKYIAFLKPIMRITRSGKSYAMVNNFIAQIIERVFTMYIVYIN
jgi:hypothetical protein